MSVLILCNRINNKIIILGNINFIGLKNNILNLKYKYKIYHILY